MFANEWDSVDIRCSPSETVCDCDIQPVNYDYHELPVALRQLFIVDRDFPTSPNNNARICIQREIGRRMK